MTSQTYDRIIDKHERLKLVPYSDMQISRMEGVGTFPQRIPIGANRVGWSLNEVLEWIAAKKADRRAINNPPEINSRSNAGAVK